MLSRSVSRPRADQRVETITRRLDGADAGTDVQIDFAVPAGAQRVGVRVDGGAAQVAMALFDHRGPGWGSAGFRGVYGVDRSHAHVSARHASRSFLPGPVERGIWSVVVPVLSVARPTHLAVTVTLRLRTTTRPVVRPRPAAPPPARQVVRAVPGWYRGDLHCHTRDSSDAWATGAPLSVPDWGSACARLGLDFAAMTDHNVVSQNHDVRDASRRGVLLLAGEEMTSWQHGHATVAGLPVDAWLDWRQRPAGLPLGDHERRITAFVAIAREMGTYSAAAHPMRRSAPWQFLDEAAADRAALPDGLEVWNGSTFSEGTIAAWESFLARGWRVTASGGSDFHGWNRTGGPGRPTTIVHASRLGRDDLVAALRAGRCSVSRAPDGGELYLSAAGPGGQEAIVGGTVHGRGGDTSRITVIARRGRVAADVGPLTVRLLRDRREIATRSFSEASTRLDIEVPIAPDGYVRAELRREDPAGALAPRGSDLEALTNPVWLSTEPGDPEPVSAPPPPSLAG